MSKTRKRCLAMLAVCSAATLFQVGLPTGCAQTTAQIVVNGIDFCSIFNCTGGTFFNWCNPRVLADCPSTTGTASP